MPQRLSIMRTKSYLFLFKNYDTKMHAASYYIPFNDFTFPFVIQVHSLRTKTPCQSWPFTPIMKYLFSESGSHCTAIQANLSWNHCANYWTLVPSGKNVVGLSRWYILGPGGITRGLKRNDRVEVIATGNIPCCERYMWHDQEEWVGCRPYCFWDIGKNSVPIPLFYIVLALTNSS